MRRRLVLFPLLGVVLLALIAFVLVKTGRIDLPFGGGDEVAEADGDAGSEDGDKKDRKKGKKGDDDEEEIIPVPVELAQADARQISAYYRASSVVEADRLVQLVARTQGRIRKVNVEEGDWVQSGQILAELENDREQIGLRQAELRVSDEKRELDRSRNLREQELVTVEEYNTQESAYELAVTEKDLAAIKLEETLVRASFDGQNTERHIVPGQYIPLASSLFTVVDFEPLRVRIHLPETIARKVTAGDGVHLDVEAVGAPVPATVERISPVVDPGTSTVRLTLLVGGDGQALRVGGFVKVRVTTDTQTEALSVPKVALVEEGGLRSVFVAEADSVRKVEVKTGLYDETHIEVLEGLETGDWVVALGQGGLRTGSRVDVLNAQEVGWVAPEPEEGEDVEEGDADEADGAQVANAEGAAVAALEGSD